MFIFKKTDKKLLKFIEVLEVPGSIFLLRAKFDLRKLWKFSSVIRNSDDALDHTYFE